MANNKHDVRIDREKLHPWLNHKLGLLLKECAKQSMVSFPSINAFTYIPGISARSSQQSVSRIISS